MTKKETYKLALGNLGRKRLAKYAGATDAEVRMIVAVRRKREERRIAQRNYDQLLLPRDARSRYKWVAASIRDRKARARRVAAAAALHKKYGGRRLDRPEWMDAVRFGAEAKRALVQYIVRRMQRAGWRVDHRSKGRSGRVDSYYLTRGFGDDSRRVRVSNHELPWHDEREHNRTTFGCAWETEIVARCKTDFLTGEPRVFVETA